MCGELPKARALREGVLEKYGAKKDSPRLEPPRDGPGSGGLDAASGAGVALACSAQDAMTVRENDEEQTELRRMREAILVDAWDLQQTPLDSPLRSDRELLMEGVRQCGEILQFASPELQDDRELVWEAVCSTWRALEHASETLRADKGLVKEAMRQNWRALFLAGEEMLSDGELLIAAVREEPDILERAPEELLRDACFMLDAAQRNLDALEHADPVLLRDRSFMLDLVAKKGQALKFAAQELRTDHEIIVKALANDGKALLFLPESLRSNPEYVALSQQTHSSTRRKGAAVAPAKGLLPARPTAPPPSRRQSPQPRARKAACGARHCGRSEGCLLGSIMEHSADCCEVPSIASN